MHVTAIQKVNQACGKGEGEKSKVTNESGNEANRERGRKHSSARDNHMQLSFSYPSVAALTIVGVAQLL